MNEYKLGIKRAFWTIIRELLKEYTGCNFIKLRNIVVYWVKTCIDELVEEEMGSDIQVDQDDSKPTVETFGNWWEIIEDEIKQSK